MVSQLLLEVMKLVLKIYYHHMCLYACASGRASAYHGVCMEAQGQTPGGFCPSPVSSEAPAQVLELLLSLTGPEATLDQYVLQKKQYNRFLF